MGLCQSNQIIVEQTTSTAKLDHHQKHSLDHTHFYNLSDEIILEIISYISHAPFESSNEDPTSSLTHTIPYISKQLYTISLSQSLWIASLIRLVERNPLCWKYAFCKMLRVGNTIPKWSEFYDAQVDRNDFMLGSNVKNMESLEGQELHGLIWNVYTSVQVQIEMEECKKSHNNHDNDGDGGSGVKFGTPLEIHNHTENDIKIIPQSKGAKEFYIQLIQNYICKYQYQCSVCQWLYEGDNLLH